MSKIIVLGISFRWELNFWASKSVFVINNGTVTQNKFVKRSNTMYMENSFGFG